MPEIGRAQAAVSLEVEPLDRYTDRYGRAYRSSWWRRDSPWRRTWTVRDEAELITERRRASPEGSELLRFAEEQKLRDGLFADFDRPGPLPPTLAPMHRGFVALDIAVRGESVRGKDLDNLAHLLLVSIEEKLCVRRGTVLSYRVYAAQGGPEGIQIRIMDKSRMLGLEIALSSACLDPSRLVRLERWAETHRQRQSSP
jgi:hypothetical protein